MVTTNTNTTTPRAAKGDIIQVLATRGVRRLNIGLSTSMKQGDQDVADVQPDEALKVLEVKGGGFYLVERPDGTQVHTHDNHINSATLYNQTRKRSASSTTATATPVTGGSRLKRAIEGFKAAKAELEAARQEEIEIQRSIDEAAELLGSKPSAPATVTQITEAPAAEGTETEEHEMTEAEELAQLEEQLAQVG